MAAEFKVAQPLEYYRKFLEQDIRPDGRDLGEIRPTLLNLGSITTANGSALVKLGNTSVVCGIKAELASPKPEEPNKGFIVPNVDLSPLCSSRFRPGPPSEQAQVCSQFVMDLIENSKCLCAEDLCILKGKLVWVLYCDLLCLNYDGNILDACLIALMAALKTTTLPETTVDEETEKVQTFPGKRKQLLIHHHPISTSFAVFDDEIIFTDPTDEEECLATGVVTIATVENGDVCAVHKPGGSMMNDGKLSDCIDRAKLRGKEVRRLIDETIHSVER
ncbi:exosome complex component RRP43-like [Lineus longissimus]|uniref:exosome complex component RRP43-like n=1 Tax=Lineus longissimus TaxID=88925 RepID=UPI002B4CB0DE